MSVATSIHVDPIHMCGSAFVLCLQFGVQMVATQEARDEGISQGRIPCLLLTHLTLLSFCCTHVPKLPSSYHAFRTKFFFFAWIVIYDPELWRRRHYLDLKESKQ